jgi:antitoxin (DNA-binding transcriptional repressor) of toxin-antitoxin stability system
VSPTILRLAAAKSVGVHEAKTQLSRLLQRVEQGEEDVITRRGHEVARRTFGIDRDVFIVPADFDAPLPNDVLAAFES